MKSSNLYVNLEGPPGTGKDTQSIKIKDYFTKIGIHAEIINEPSKEKGTIGRDVIRENYLKRNDIGPHAMMGAYYADRMVKRIVEYNPALLKGIVIGNRNYLSTAVYQTQVQKGLSVEEFLQYHTLCKPALAVPDLNIIMDITPEEAAKRRFGDANSTLDRFEKDIETIRKTCEGYKELPKIITDERMVLVDANSRNIDEIFQNLIKVIESYDLEFSNFKKLNSGFWVLKK